MADVANAKRNRTLDVATAPRRAVTGQPSIPRSGMVVLAERLTPFGAARYEVKNGLWPWASAKAVQFRNHTSWAWSKQAQLTMWCGSRGETGQKARQARSTYTAAASKPSAKRLDTCGFSAAESV